MNAMNAPRIMVWIAIIQFICTMLFYLYTFTKESGRNEKEPDKEFVKKTQEYVDRTVAGYQEREQKYQERIDSLNMKLMVTDIQLARAKAASHRDRSILDEMLKQKWDTMSTQDRQWACDTLRDQVEHYLFTSAEKDTLYERKISSLEKIEDNLVAQVASCDTTRERLVDKLEKSLEETKAVTKEMKKQKRRKNVMKVGAAVLGGIAVFLAVH